MLMHLSQQYAKIGGKLAESLSAPVKAARNIVLTTYPIEQ